MKPNLRVGAIVRFLNAVGGGRVARISKDMAWVEDADGFEIPTPISECVVVEEGDSFVPKYKPPTFVYTKEAERHDAAQGEAKHRLRVEDFEDFDTAPLEGITEPQRLPHTFLPARGEVAAYLAIIPQDLQRLGQSHYDLHLVNDCDYTLYYTVCTQVGAEQVLRGHGVLYPRADLALSLITSQELGQIQSIAIHLLAIAENPGLFKGHYLTSLKVDARKWLRASTFVPNDFFDEPALLLDLVDQRACQEPQPREEEPHLEALLEGLGQGLGTSGATQPQAHTQAKTKAIKTDEPLVIDLHIDSLIDTTAGMSSADILSYQIGIFNKTMQASLGHTGRKIVFIHGKGDGILRRKLLSELGYRYKHCSWQDASFQQYSYGATQVTIGQKIKG